MTEFSRRRMLGGAAAATGIVVANQSLSAVPAAALPAGVDAPAAATITPNDPRYIDLVVGNNTRWVARPDYVRVVHSTQQVVDAVREAVRSHKRLSIHGGGHCYADFVFNPDVRVVLDMSEMNDVYFDTRRNAFVVEGGATLLNVYDALYRGWGVTIPGGMCYSVGVGGHISGGGYGLLSRRHGLTVDHLDAVEVVTVDSRGNARAVLATRDPADRNHDLWWAHTGGGGGNFGVVTKYFFRSPGATGTDPAKQLIQPPKEVLVCAIGLPWNELDEASYVQLVRNYGAWHIANSGPNSPYADLCSFLMMNHRSNNFVGFLTVMDATVPNAERLLTDYLRTVAGGIGVQARPVTGPIGELGPMPDLFTPTRLPWLQSMRFLGTNNPILTNPTSRGAHKSAYLKANFTEAQAATMYQHLTRTDFQNPAAMAVLLSFGGKINSVPSAATAAAQRSSAFKGLFQSFWNDKADDAQHIAWVRAVYGEVFASTGGYPVPNDVTDGCYINYPDMDINNPQINRSGVPWHALYYKDNYPRLQRVKAAHDPLNVFRHSQSISV